jgi:hypothetical protein
VNGDLFDRSGRAFADAVEAGDYERAERMLAICFALALSATPGNARLPALPPDRPPDRTGRGRP